MSDHPLSVGRIPTSCHSDDYEPRELTARLDAARALGGPVWAVTLWPGDFLQRGDIRFGVGGWQPIRTGLIGLGVDADADCFLRPLVD